MVRLETPLSNRLGSSLHQERISTYHLQLLNRAIGPDQRLEHNGPLDTLLSGLFGVVWLNSRYHVAIPCWWSLIRHSRRRTLSIRFGRHRGDVVSGSWYCSSWLRPKNLLAAFVHHHGAVRLDGFDLRFWSQRPCNRAGRLWGNSCVMSRHG